MSLLSRGELLFVFSYGCASAIAFGVHSDAPHIAGAVLTGLLWTLYVLFLRFVKRRSSLTNDGIRGAAIAQVLLSFLAFIRILSYCSITQASQLCMYDLYLMSLANCVGWAHLFTVAFRVNNRCANCRRRSGSCAH